MKNNICIAVFVLFCVWALIFTIKGVELLFRQDWSYKGYDKYSPLSSFCKEIAESNNTGYRETEIRALCLQSLGGKLDEKTLETIRGNR